MKTKIVLVASPGNNLKEYKNQIGKFDVDISIVSSFQELETELSRDTFNGIIVDLKTKLKAPKEEKELAYDLLNHYPVLQTRWVPDSNKLQSMSLGKSGRGISLEDFITNQCPGFYARKIRSNVRKKIHFNILLSKTGSFALEDVDRATTLNVSKSGCFIITPDKWDKKESAAFIIKELSIRSPVVGEIKWRIPWGNKMKIPGIGVKFEDIQEKQLEEIEIKYGCG